MAFRVRRKQNVNAWRVGLKIVGTLIGLWVSGFTLNIVYDLLNGTASPFYKGLTLIGLTVSDIVNTSGTYDACGLANSCTGASCHTIYNCITGQNSTSLLAIVGVIAIIWIVFEFIDVRF